MAEAAYTLMRGGLSDLILDDRTTATSLIAVQGPSAEAILLSVLGQDGLEGPITRPFGIVETTIDDTDAIISRTGYTGEDGVELVVSSEQGPRLWGRLMELGAAPCGLGARDVLRLEAGLRLHGTDMDATTTPFEAGLQRYVHMDGDFSGHDALLQQQDRGITRVLAGLNVRSRSVARHGHRVLHQATEVGVVTSGTFSPTLRANIAMAYVPPELADAGQLLDVDIRGESVEAEVVSLPFYSRKRSG